MRFVWEVFFFSCLNNTILSSCTMEKKLPVPCWRTCVVTKQMVPALPPLETTFDWNSTQIYPLRTTVSGPTTLLWVIFYLHLDLFGSCHSVLITKSYCFLFQCFFVRKMTCFLTSDLLVEHLQHL